MNPNKLLTHEEVFHALHTVRGCRRLCDAGDELGMWMTPNGHFVTVPELGPDKVCPQFALDDILTQVDSWSAGAATGTDAD